MAFNVRFYQNFSKRINSCKRPTESGAVHECTLKGECSVLHPTITIVRLSNDASPDSYNYCLIARFNRYYWVRDWTWENGIWMAHLDVDVLASWRPDIGNTSAYIERCASEYDGAIIDRQYPVTTDFSTESVSLSSSYYNVAPSGGCFVLGIVNNANFSTSQAGGAVTYYAMTVSQMRSLMHYLLSDGFLEDNGFPAIPTTGQQLLQDTAKALINPVQYITSCMWFPVSADSISDGNNVGIVLGYYNLDSNVATGKKVTAFAYTTYITGNIPIHPQASTRGKYLNYSPYTRMTLNIPPFGSIPLDTSFCEIGSYLYCKVMVDIITGKAQMRVTIQPDSSHLTDNNIVTECSAMFGIPIQISQLTPDYLSAIGSVIRFGTNVGVGLASGIPFAGDASAIMSLPSVFNAVDSLMPQVRVEGVSGSFVQNILPASLTAQFFVITDEDNAELGRPLCAIRTINTLSGFIKCGEATTNFPCLAEEKTQIHSFMINGFFWE